MGYNQGMQNTFPRMSGRRFVGSTVVVAALSLMLVGCSDAKSEIQSIGDVSTTTTITPQVGDGPLFTQRPDLPNGADAVVVLADEIGLDQIRTIATVRLDNGQTINRITIKNSEVNNATLELVGRYNDRVYTVMSDRVPAPSDTSGARGPSTVYSFPLLESVNPIDGDGSNADAPFAEFAIADTTWVRSSTSGRFIAVVSSPNENKRVVEFIDLDRAPESGASRKPITSFEFDVATNGTNLYFWDTLQDRLIVARQGEGSNELELVEVDPNTGDTKINAIDTGLAMAEADLTHLVQPDGASSVRVSIASAAVPLEESAEVRDFKLYALDGTQIAAGTYEASYGDNVYETPDPEGYFADGQTVSRRQFVERLCVAASCTVIQVDVFDWNAGTKRTLPPTRSVTTISDQSIADIIL